MTKVPIWMFDRNLSHSRMKLGIEEVKIINYHLGEKLENLDYREHTHSLTLWSLKIQNFNTFKKKN